MPIGQFHFPPRNPWLFALGQSNEDRVGWAQGSLTINGTYSPPGYFPLWWALNSPTPQYMSIENPPPAGRSLSISQIRIPICVWEIGTQNSAILGQNLADLPQGPAALKMRLYKGHEIVEDFYQQYDLGQTLSGTTVTTPFHIFYQCNYATDTLIVDGPLLYRSGDSFSIEAEMDPQSTTMPSAFGVTLGTTDPSEAFSNFSSGVVTPATYQYQLVRQ